MTTPRFAGFYVPGSIIITIGAPVGPLGLAVNIPNLPVGLAFPLNTTGRAADSFATAAQTVDTVTMVVGSDGEVVFVLSNDMSGNMVVNLQRSSVMNLALTQMHKAMRNPVAPLLFTVPVTIKDPNAVGSIFEGNNCAIQRSPDLDYGATEGMNAWTFLAAEYNGSHGARIF
jgi:hypothetical protein